MKLCDITRNDIPAALAYLDERFDRNQPIDGDDYSILLMLQDDPARFQSAAAEHMEERARQGKPVPRRE